MFLRCWSVTCPGVLARTGAWWGRWPGVRQASHYLSEKEQAGPRPTGCHQNITCLWEQHEAATGPAFAQRLRDPGGFVPRGGWPELTALRAMSRPGCLHIQGGPSQEESRLRLSVKSVAVNVFQKLQALKSDRVASSPVHQGTRSKRTREETVSSFGRNMVLRTRIPGHVQTLGPPDHPVKCLQETIRREWLSFTYAPHLLHPGFLW